MLKGCIHSISTPLCILFFIVLFLKEYFPIYGRERPLLRYLKKVTSLFSLIIGQSLFLVVFERFWRELSMYNFLMTNELLYKYQSVFLPKHSTTYQLIDIYHHTCQAMDYGHNNSHALFSVIYQNRLIGCGTVVSYSN